MRYTEKPHRRDTDDVIGFLLEYFLMFILAPKRLMDEIGTKIMFIGKSAVEKSILVTMSIQILLILVDIIMFVVNRKITFFDGSVPFVVKLISIIITGVGSMYIVSRFEYMKTLKLTNPVKFDDEDYTEEELKSTDIGQVDLNSGEESDNSEPDLGKYARSNKVITTKTPNENSEARMTFGDEEDLEGRVQVSEASTSWEESYGNKTVAEVLKLDEEMDRDLEALGSNTFEDELLEELKEDDEELFEELMEDDIPEGEKFIGMTDSFHVDSFVRSDEEIMRDLQNLEKLTEE